MGSFLSFFLTFSGKTNGYILDVLLLYFLSICIILLSRSVWYDNNMDELNVQGMKSGVQKSAVFLLFMTDGIFHRPYVRLEIEEALKLGKPILVVHEIDGRHVSYLEKEKRSCFSYNKSLLTSNILCFIFFIYLFIDLFAGCV